MFTGIISEIGVVSSMRKGANATRLEISCQKITDGLGMADSVSVNGVCLSVTDIGRSVSFDVVANTIAKTNLKRLRNGDKVNLENAMNLGDKISGHMVSGHIDGERKIIQARNISKGWMLEVAVSGDDMKYIIPRGSVAIDGVSLTIAEVKTKSFSIFLIPITLKDTILKLKKTGDYVNVEFDIMAKYSEKHNNRRMTKEDLRETGFLE